MLGGGGTPSPSAELALQLVSAGLIGWWLIALDRAGQHLPRPALAVCLVMLALPAIQLIPLPPVLWHNLPGRQAELDALQLIGAADSWRPWSVAPDRTFTSLLAMLPPLAMLLMAAGLGRRDRTRLLAAAGLTALASLVVGAAQIRGDALRFYGDVSGALTGFQANRNTQADVLLVGLLATVTWLRIWNEGRRRPLPALAMPPLTAVVAGLFAVGIFTTGSRSGIALLAIALPACAIIAWPRGAGKAATIGAIGAVMALTLAGGAVMLSSNRTVTGVLSRFTGTTEFRPELWRDTRFAITESFPFGTGIGTFVPVMIAAERLEVVDATMPNRAHNEYLEFTLETGLFGVFAVMGLIGFFAFSAVREWRKDEPMAHAQLLCAGAALCLVALHSLVDYPFRSMSMACLVCTIAALLLPSPERSRAG
ncbi:O-antigen ligase family protein [Novosphingobium sp. KCTC 2891]|uniref:O-antigen ligase family protein n=1 Tax=Novosphingobium sp. KCTC 2891 TaxID=2989730 RepID=UPI0022227296|nr:O-antigen ligase family protein [Novosphingobium sp. KCTC 2891]MCW1383254.1 O-antigen ligase family protein [Novosphingobium sp. KCTC 2891]